MKTVWISFFLVLVFVIKISAVQAEQNETVAFPVASPEFSLVIPFSWSVQEASETDNYQPIVSATGALLSFRTTSGGAPGLSASIQSTITYLGAHYSEVVASQPDEDWLNGMAGLYAVATGLDSNGNEVTFGLGAYALPSGQIAELWFVSHDEDAEGAAAAEKIIHSLQHREN